MFHIIKTGTKLILAFEDMVSDSSHGSTVETAVTSESAYSTRELTSSPTGLVGMGDQGSEDNRAMPGQLPHGYRLACGDGGTNGGLDYSPEASGQAPRSH